jgi:hypothetical protein
MRRGRQETSRYESRLAELRALAYISDRARKADESATFSADIRQGVPNL